MNSWTIPVLLALTFAVMEVVWVIQRGAAGWRGYLLLLSVDAGLLVLALRDPHFSEEGPPSAQAVAGVLLCALIVLVPRLVERGVRAALASERFALAAQLGAVKEILQPGLVATAERERLDDLAAVHAGRGDEAVRALRARLSEAEPPEDAALHERLLTVLCLAKRWREAASHWQAHGAGRDPLRHPGLAIQMVRTFGELGELEHAGEIVFRVEQAARQRDPSAFAVLLQVRLLFVACAGGTPALEKLLALPELARLPSRVVTLLREAARSADERLLAGREPSVEVARFIDGVIARTTEELREASAREPRTAPRAWVTLALVAVNALVFLALGLTASFDSASVFVRAGANVHAAVRAGEWWRLWTAMFLHGGPLGWQLALAHVGLNMLSLLSLGGLVEPLVGRWRYLIVYAVAGIAGNLASAYSAKPHAFLSVGASGAVMGVAGALVVVLLRRDGGWANTWRRALIVRLGVLLALQVAFGWLLPIIDNFAHVGGLFGGMAATWLFAEPGALSRGRAGTVAVVVALGALAASTGLAVARVATTTLDDTIARTPPRPVSICGVEIAVTPVTGFLVSPQPEWKDQAIAIDAVNRITYAPHLLDGTDAGAALEACMARDRTTAAARGGRALTVVDPVRVAGWEAAAQRDEKGKQLMLYYARVEGGRIVVVEVNVPDEGLPARTRAELERVLASAKRAP